MNSRKGISPLIATVLLIAFTMAIAGMMATWATGFVSTKMSETSNQTGITCSGAMDIDARIYNGQGFAIVDITSSNTVLTDWKAYLFYENPSNNEDVTISLSNSTIGLRTGSTYTFNFTNSSGSPQYLKLSAGNCPVASKTVPITISS